MSFQSLDIVEELMSDEEPKVRLLYASLPFTGSAEEQEACLRLLYRHSRDVANLAIEIALRHSELSLDMEFVRRAALLHDVGIVETNAPSIHCHGSEPYIRHGEIGYAILKSNGLEKCGNVAMRHTGAGITLEEIAQQQLPLKSECMPVSLEEKLICYADKFYSKSHPDRRKTTSEARRSLEKFGTATLARFDAMTELFGEV